MAQSRARSPSLSARLGSAPFSKSSFKVAAPACSEDAALISGVRPKEVLRALTSAPIPISFWMSWGSSQCVELTRSFLRILAPLASRNSTVGR